MTVLFNTKLNKIWKSELVKLQKEFPDITFMTDVKADDIFCTDPDVIIGGFVTGKLVDSAKKLKLVIVPFTGVDHLPLDLMRERNILVANSHGNARAVAERSLALILAFYGRIVEYHNDLAMGHWHGFWVGKGLDDTWESIIGKSCSIIGAGKIGTALAEMLKPFNMRVTGYKRSSLETQSVYFDEIVYNLDEAIDKSEILVVALPLTGKTRGVFSAERLKRMKGKVIINVGRGSLIDQEALFANLQNGVLKGAAVDCWYSYPKNGDTEGFPSVYPIHKLKNIVLSPHVAGYTSSAAEGGIKEAFENLRSYLNTGSPEFSVDMLEGY